MLSWKKPRLKRSSVHPLCGENITDAIAEFEKTLITPDLPHLRMVADEKIDGATEKKGHQLFHDNKVTRSGGIISAIPLNR